MTTEVLGCHGAPPIHIIRVRLRDRESIVKLSRVRNDFVLDVMIRMDMEDVEEFVKAIRPDIQCPFPRPKTPVVDENLSDRRHHAMISQIFGNIFPYRKMTPADAERQMYASG